MRRRKVRWVLAGLAMAVLAVGVVTLCSPPDRITPKNCHLITRGMSREQVYAILGPPGDYRSRLTKDGGNRIPRSPTLSEVKLERPPPGTEARHTAVWCGDLGDIFVLIYTEGVVEADFSDTVEVEQTLLDDLLWRAKRLWRRWFPER